jgi:hypothetical protein
MAPPPWAYARAMRLLQRVPELDRKLVDRGRSIDVLAGMFGHAGSGGRAVTTRPGRYLPSRTRGGAGELRALLQHARDPNVTQLSLIPSGTSRTPDMVARYRPDTGRGVERIEISSVTGGGAGYRDVGRGGFGATPAAIAERIVRKARRGQLTRPLVTPAMGVVPPRGTIDIVLPSVPRHVLGRAAGLALRTLAREGHPGVRRVILRPAGQRPVTYRRR